MIDIIKFLFRLITTILISLIILINIKKDVNFKNKFYEIIYENNFDFAYINSLYNKYFGGSIPFDKIIMTEPVFKETLNYNSLEPYYDGAKLSIEENYLVPIINSGLVVYIGNKDNYGKVVVIEQEDGVDCWYGNLDTVNVKLYDYVESGSLLGSASNNLYLVYKDDGGVIPYEKYLP